MTQTAQTGWQQVSDGDTTTVTVDSNEEGAIAVQNAQIRWRGVDETDSYTDYKNYGPNSETLENQIGGATKTATNDVKSGSNQTIIDNVGDALPNLPSNTEFVEHEILFQSDLPNETVSNSETLTAYPNRDTGSESVSFTIGDLIDSTYHNSTFFIESVWEVYVKAYESNSSDVQIVVNNPFGNTEDRFVSPGERISMGSGADSRPEDEIGTSYSASIEQNADKIEYIELVHTETRYGEIIDEFFSTYESSGTSDPDDNRIPADGSRVTFGTQTLTSYIGDGEGTDDIFVDGGEFEDTNIGGQGVLTLRTKYQGYTSESITINSPTIQDSSYDHNRTDWDITVDDGEIVYQRSGDSGEWKDPQTTSSDVSSFTYDGDGDDLILETTTDAGKVIATGDVEVRASDIIYTTVDTEDPTVDGDVSASYGGFLDDGEVSPWQSIDALTAGENTFTHYINGSNEAEYQIEYEYAYINPEPTYGTFSVADPSTSTWYEVAVMDESDPAVVRDAVRVYDGTDWRPIDVVPASHPDALLFTRFWSGDEWLALRAYNTTPT
jgi:hypothetical protein